MGACCPCITNGRNIGRKRSAKTHFMAASVTYGAVRG